MHSLTPAACRRGRTVSLWLLSLLFLLMSLHSEAAFSASLTVKIRQVNPDGAIQQVTCTDNTNCLLPLNIQTGTTSETVTVHLLFAPGNVLFDFETPKGYLYARDSKPSDPRAFYRTLWHGSTAKDNPSVNDVSLFLPLVARAQSTPLRATVDGPVADLEITTEALP